MLPHSNERDTPASPGHAGEIPEPLRAVAGLAATMLDQVRHLPTAITGLPVRVAGIAMQTSLRLQQRYAGLVVKGDELLTQISRAEDTDPPWATFDDDIVEVADSVTENVGVDVTTADDSGTPSASEVALPPPPGPTRSRSRRNASSTTRMGHAPSAFDLTADIQATGTTQETTEDGGVAATDIGSNGHATTAEQAPVPGYDAFTLAQLRARLRTFDSATLHDLLNYEREQRARTSYLAMLENRLNRSRGQG